MTKCKNKYCKRKVKTENTQCDRCEYLMQEIADAKRKGEL